MRLVLDTNVWLDLLVFRDPAVARLGRALLEGEAIALVDERMLDECARVLAYPVLGLDADRQAATLRDVARLSSACRVAPSDGALPRCRDPDDQMFVELALTARVDALLSRDDALLRMAPRLRRAGVAVLTPVAWCASRGG